MKDLLYDVIKSMNSTVSEKMHRILEISFHGGSQGFTNASAVNKETRYVNAVY
jgi:hypothetical protein